MVTVRTDPTPTAHRTLRRARRLVAVGSAAGPFLAVAYTAQALTRAGYDITRHPMSLLALGDGGAVQVAVFVVTGLLLLVLARGLSLVGPDGPGGRWLPRLVTVAGLGLVASGLFTTDPGAGFPAGAPAGRPDLSWHGLVHEVAFVVVMVSWTAAVVVLYLRARRSSDALVRTAAVVTLVTVVVLGAAPHAGSFPVRTVAASVLQLGFLAAVAMVGVRRAEAAGVPGADPAPDGGADRGTPVRRRGTGRRTRGGPPPATP